LRASINELSCAVNRRINLLTLIYSHVRLLVFCKLLFIALSVFSGCASAQSLLPPSTPSLQAVISQYAQAWASRDAEKITALHTADSVFVLNVSKQNPAVGKEAILFQFQQILRDNPQYSSKVNRMSWGADFVVIEYSIRMQPVGSFVLGQRRFTPKSGVAYHIPAIDVIHVKEGLVSAKYTYIDTETVHANSSSVSDIDKP
jgi:hypothetical protein